MKYNFNFNKLKGRIKEHFGTIRKFSKAMNFSPSTLSAKLNNKSPLTNVEMKKMIILLHIKDEEVKEIFFTI